jgi:DNA-binding transcriptional LysR family regulator
MIGDSKGIHLGSIQLFCKAAELESFTAAASALGLTPAAVSRSVQRVEERLGVRLFARTTRQIRLTEQGRIYYTECRQALEQIAMAENLISGDQASARGTVRLSVPTTFGHYRVLPLLPTFCARYPELGVEVNISNQNIEFVEEDYDLAIRLGIPRDSRLVARKLEDATLGVFASKDYLAQHGEPQDLDDLAHHACIQFMLPSTGRGMSWIFKNAGADVEVPIRGQVRCSEDVLGCVTYAKAGGGLCQIYHFIVEEDLRAGRLVEVLQAFSGRSRPFSILYQQNRHLPARVRLLVNFLEAELANGKKSAGRDRLAYD